MLTFSANINTALAQPTIETFYMLRIVDYDGSILISTTSYFTDVQLVNDAGTAIQGYSYTSDGTLLSVDPPQLNTTVDREQYKIVLADNNLLDSLTSKLSLVKNNLVGKTMEGRFGFVNTATGMPYLNINDCPIIYKGRVDSAGYLLKTGEIGENALQITGSSPMRNLDMKKSLYLSRDFMRKRNANDSSCDQIYEGSGSITLKWGRI